MRIHQVVVGLLQENCYILEDDAKHCVVIDPGASFERIDRVIREQELQVKAILLTHGHFDHIGAVSALREYYSAPVLISAEDAEMLESPERNGSRMFGRRIIPTTADILLKDQQELVFGNLRLLVIATPGHSKGSVCYLCGNALFTGDTLFAGGAGRTDLYGGSFAALRDSLQRLTKLDPTLQVYPGHGETTVLGQECRHNIFLRDNNDDFDN